VALPLATFQIETHHGKRFRGGEVEAAVEESTLLEATVVEESMKSLEAPPAVVAGVIDKGGV